MANKFKDGDFVQLKSGGPRMVVEEYSEYYKHYICSWFAGSKHNKQGFKEAALQPYEDDE